jgi:hypothetical protein
LGWDSNFGAVTFLGSALRFCGGTASGSGSFGAIAWTNVTGIGLGPAALGAAVDTMSGNSSRWLVSETAKAESKERSLIVFSAFDSATSARP